MQGFDILITNARVIDGTGNDAFMGKVGIKGDRIVHVSRESAPVPFGPREGEASSFHAAKTVIDARGKVVCPGFVDPHAHLELLILHQPRTEAYVAQGITTAINGNCGHSVTPYGTERVLEYQYRNGLITQRFRSTPVPFRWNSFAEYIEGLEASGGTTISHGFLLGHGTLRWAVMGGAINRPPNEDERKELERLVREGLEDGALGMSTGLAYIPSKFAATDEIVELAKVLAEYDATYASHIRYDLGIEAATAEAIEIGRRSGARVQVSHLHMGAPGAYELIAKAVEEGQDVAADTIPRSTGHLVRGDRLVQFVMTMSPEYFDVGVEGVLQAMRTRKGRELFREQEPFFKHDPEKVYIVNTGDPALEGKTVAEVAATHSLEPSDLIFDLLLAKGKAVTFWFGKDRQDAAPDFPPDEVIRQPWLSPGTDILMVEDWDPTGWYELMRPGCMVTFMKQARRAGVRLEEIIRRMTSFPAKQFRIGDRGVLEPGKAADVIVFDPDTLSYPSLDAMDYSDPYKRASGMDYVIVNGTVVMAHGKQLDARPGRPVTRRG
ncbi:MAG: amidohydrolase family protein [Firmicutes bacterium]|nr:amidohydrolase family protein [Bacillota bacterium]MDH7495478.1 amidohydrolase family protein [Bacillota bacterium]